jgi:DNA polymerase III subunit delta
MTIFLFGKDAFRSRKKLNEIVENFRAREDKTGYNTAILDAAKTSIEELSRAMLSSAFLANKRMVVINGMLSRGKDEQEQVVYMLGKMTAATTTVFYETLDEAACKKSPLYPLLITDKYHWEFSPLTEAETIAFVSAEAKRLGANFSAPAIATLARLVKNDSARAANETAKLAAYAAGRRVEINDVYEMVLGEPEEDMFGFLDAVAAKNSARAAAMLENQINAGIEPMQILAMLARSVRLLIQAKDCLERGLRPDEATKEIGAHPFAVKKSLAQARGFEMNVLKNLHAALLDADRKIKSGLVPSPRVALDLIVARAVLAGR